MTQSQNGQSDILRVHAQIPTVLSITGAALICVSTLSLGAFEKTHPKPSTSPDISLRGGNEAGVAIADGLGPIRCRSLR